VTFLKHPEVAIPVITGGVALVSSPFVARGVTKHNQIKILSKHLDKTKQELKDEGLLIEFKNICEEKEIKNPHSKGE
jgi:NAD(P)H-dependent flavin oxidoreductase YrpB (nitropropane dioxygenase family)